MVLASPNCEERTHLVGVIGIVTVGFVRGERVIGRPRGEWIVYLEFVVIDGLDLSKISGNQNVGGKAVAIFDEITVVS